MLQAGPIALIEDTPYFRTCVSRYLVSQRLEERDQICMPGLPGSPLGPWTPCASIEYHVLPHHKDNGLAKANIDRGSCDHAGTMDTARKLVSVKDTLFLNVSNR